MNIPRAGRDESTRHSLTQAEQGKIQDEGRSRSGCEDAPDLGVYSPNDLGAIHNLMKT